MSGTSLSCLGEPAMTLSSGHGDGPESCSGGGGQCQPSRGLLPFHSSLDPASGCGGTIRAQGLGWS